MVEYICNPSTQEVEAGGLQIPGQFGINSEILSQKKPNYKQQQQNKQTQNQSK
jgi:hypothetical protein